MAKNPPGTEYCPVFSRKLRYPNIEAAAPNGGWSTLRELNPRYQIDFYQRSHIKRRYMVQKDSTIDVFCVITR